MLKLASQTPPGWAERAVRSLDEGALTVRANGHQRPLENQVETDETIRADAPPDVGVDLFARRPAVIVGRAVRVERGRVQEVTGSLVGTKETQDGAAETRVVAAGRIHERLALPRRHVQGVVKDALHARP